jgi:cytochrome P450 family 6
LLNAELPVVLQSIPYVRVKLPAHMRTNVPLISVEFTASVEQSTLNYQLLFFLAHFISLHFIFTETLRKYPVLPFLDRTCLNDYKLPSPSGEGTVILPAGTYIYIPLLGPHYDPKYFPDPEKFEPERFTEENKQSRPKYAHIPFGEGPRMCIGKDKCMNIQYQYYNRD